MPTPLAASGQIDDPMAEGAVAGNAYRAKVLGYDPIAYWMLSETSGQVAACEVNPAQNGSYARDVADMGTGPGIGDGGTAPLFTPSADRADVISAPLAAAFDGSEGALLAWGKVRDVSVWSDGQIRYLARFAGDVSDYASIRKVISPRLQILYKAGGVTENITEAYSALDWFLFGVSWSKANDRVRLWLNGTKRGSDSTGLGNWIDTLATAYISVNGVACWDGYLAHAMVFDYEPDADIMADLAMVG